jgi:DNA polymerase III alpha subunit
VIAIEEHDWDAELVECPANFVPVRDIRNWHERSLLCADTVGMFQVESRAQMASLPRNYPKRFYDVAVQVAIIRPDRSSAR